VQSSIVVHDDEDVRNALDDAAAKRAKENQAIADRERLRNEKVYDPARKFCSSVPEAETSFIRRRAARFGRACKELFIDIANSYLTAGAKESEATAAAQKAVDDFKVK
jgi:hypothetical protein